MLESFEDLFEINKVKQIKVGSIIPGTISHIGPEKVVVNVGLKSEGFVDINQFKKADGELIIKEGDTVEVELESIDNGLGHTLISFEKAERTKQWQKLSEAMKNKTIIKGIIDKTIKGGLSVNIGNIKAFLPGSLTDVSPIGDFSYLEGQESEFIVIKMDKVRNNIVVSRKAALQEMNSADREALIDSLEVGSRVKGVVKNLIEYGAFVDLGGVDGLLHNSDIAWDRVNHPSERLNIGDKINVQVLGFDKEKMRVSLGIKQMESSPWENIAATFPIGSEISGKISNITDYGAFVKIKDGIEGLVHASELDWTNINARANKIVKLDQTVNVMVLDIDEAAHRISLSIKQTKDNPWKLFDKNHKKGDKLLVTINSITDFGLFVGLEGGIDGLVHLADIDWEKPSSSEIAKNYKKGQEIEVVVLNIDSEKERISLGIKQLVSDNFSLWRSDNPKNSIVTGEVVSIKTKSATIKLADKVYGQLKISEVSEEKIDDITTKLNIGDKVESLVTHIDKKNRKVFLSIRAKNIAEEKATIIDYNKKSKQQSTTIGDLFKDTDK